MLSPGPSHWMNYWYSEVQTIYQIKMVQLPALEWLIVVLYELVNMFTPGPYSTISTSLSGTFHFSLYFALGSMTMCMARSFFLKTTTAETHSSLCWYNKTSMLIKTCPIFIYNIAGKTALSNTLYMSERHVLKMHTCGQSEPKKKNIFFLSYASGPRRTFKVIL